jgi:MFS family permease
MYSEQDLDAAVAAGVIAPDAAAALRAYAANQRGTTNVDEENFRLLTGFNDIFVAIAGVLLLVGAGWLGGVIHPAVGAASVAALAWGLAEYFTRERRMALPSILFLLAFVGGLLAASATALISDDHINNSGGMTTWQAIAVTISGVIAATGAILHWRRFKVPITVAAGAAAAAGVLIILAMGLIPALEDNAEPLFFVLGLGVFALAMWWDLSDPKRETRRSDVAFWLHLLAAPMLVHPIFWAMGLLDSEPTTGQAFVVILVYIALGWIALAIDRRALLVSALGYVIYAMGSLFQSAGAVGLNSALTAFVIGSALLLLSAFWPKARAAALRLVPDSLGSRLPATA